MNKKRMFQKLVQMLVITVMCIGMVIPKDVSFATEKQDEIMKQIDAAKAELAEAEERQITAVADYNQGSLGFIDWMLAKTDLTEAQRKDLTNARAFITNACEESFSLWRSTPAWLPASRNNMVTCLGDPNDAISLDNLETALSILRQVNYFRSTDSNYVGAMKRNEAMTNFSYMAIAQTSADRAAGLLRHSVLHSDCENLSNWSPRAWHDEIAAFNKVKEELGMDVLTSEDDVKKIESLADAKGWEVGHYTNLFLSVDQIMGAGRSSYSSRIGMCSYSASRLNLDSPNCPALYTVDEFSALFEEYYATVGPDKLQEKIDAIKEKIEKLKDLYYQNCPGHTFGDKTVVNETCLHGAGIQYTCSKCGYIKTDYTTDALGHNFQNGVCTRCKKTGPKGIDSVSWMVVGKPESQEVYQSYEVGQEAVIIINYTTASKNAKDDKFMIDIADPRILSYEPQTNYSGNIHMNAAGETTVTIYPVDNPSIAKTYTVSVEDVGGHDYVIKQTAVSGSGKTTKTCTKCGNTKEITIPTSIKEIKWFWKETDVVNYNPEMYEVGEYAEIYVLQNPDEVDNDEFVIEVSDPSVAVLSKSMVFDGLITMVKSGDVKVTIYAKYDPSIRREYTFQVVNKGERTSKVPLDHSTRTDQPTVPETSLTDPKKPTTSPTNPKTPETSPTNPKTPEASSTDPKTPETSPTDSKEAETNPTDSKKPGTNPLDSKTPETSPTDPTQTSNPTTSPSNNDDQKQQSIAQAVVVLSESEYAYDGYEKTPAVLSVSLGSATLEAGTDYTVTYKDNCNIGIAAVTVTGKGDYTGNVTKTFTIRGKKGTVVTVGVCQYKIKGQKKVTFARLGDRNVKSVKIPKAVKIGGKSFKVASIANRAFAGTKVQKVIISSNVEMIGANACRGCKKLSAVTIQSAKLKSIGRDAFRGISRTAEIKVPSKCLSAYRKLLKKGGQGKKVKIKS